MHFRVPSDLLTKTKLSACLAFDIEMILILIKKKRLIFTREVVHLASLEEEDSVLGLGSD